MRRSQGLLAGLQAVAILLTGCGKQETQCECIVFPFPVGCDSKCGVTHATVESVQKDSITVRLEHLNGAPAETRTIPRADLKLPEAETIQPGAKVLLTFSKETPKSIKAMVPNRQPVVIKRPTPLKEPARN